MRDDVELKSSHYNQTPHQRPAYRVRPCWIAMETAYWGRRQTSSVQSKPASRKQARVFDTYRHVFIWAESILLHCFSYKLNSTLQKSTTTWLFLLIILDKINNETEEQQHTHGEIKIICICMETLNHIKHITWIN